MEKKDFMAENEKYLFNTYGRAPIMLVEGKGCKVTDVEGREYLDFIAGIAACPLGHGHPALAEALAKQAGRLIHVSNLFHIEPQIELAKLLVEHTFADKAFFCNSGAEANEGAIKLARKYFHDRNDNERYHIITMEGSFHGRTLATLAATGQAKYRQGFEPTVQGFSHVPFGDIDKLESSITPYTAAILVEPIQGEGGVRVPPSDYLSRVRELCDRTGCLLMLDEVQTGIGRTGSFLAHEQYGITPDVVTLAKGLAGGAPMGAMLATDAVATTFSPGHHATTFGGNPLASAAAVTVVKEVTSDGFMRSVTEKGEYFASRLGDLAAKYDDIVDVRGLGLMQGIELARPCGSIVEVMRDKGVLVNCAADTVLRFLPPLVVTKEEIDTVIGVLDAALAETVTSGEGG